MVRTFQEGQVEESLAFAKADHRAGYNQPPVCAGRKRLAAVSLRDPKSDEIRGFTPQAQLFGVAAALYSNGRDSGQVASGGLRGLF